MTRVLLLFGVVCAVEKISVATAADLNVAQTEIVAHFGKLDGNLFGISVPREKH